VKYRHVRCIGAARLHLVISTTNVVDAVIGAVAYPLYCDLMSKEDRCVASLSDRLGMSPSESIQLLHDWIETAVETLCFPLLGD
jgi:hypothetical protein